MRVKVHFGTNRNPTIDDATGKVVGFGDDLGPVGGLSVRFGSIDFDVTLSKPEGSDATRAIVPGTFNVAEEKLEGDDQQFGSKEVFDALRTGMKDNQRDLLVYIHGFWNGFENAVGNAAEITAFYGNIMDVFAFSWPASSSTLPTPWATYVHDRRTAEASGTAMARTILILEEYLQALQKENWCKQNIHLLCHSMGNYAMHYCVQELVRLRKDGIGRLFDNIILAAADEDTDALSNGSKMQALPLMGNRVVVYSTARDVALNDLSRFTKLNGDRLGSSGPDNMAPISDKVAAVDVSDVLHSDSDHTNHQYYRINPAVRDDIVNILKGVPDHAIVGRRNLGNGRYVLI